MNNLEQLVNGIRQGRDIYSGILSDENRPSSGSAPDGNIGKSGEVTNITRPGNSEYFNSGDTEQSELALGDNLEYMTGLLRRGYAGRFAQIYIDPPFFTRSKFNASVTLKDRDGHGHRVRHLAFDDRFERSLECYIENLTARLLVMRDLLADNGTLWVHLDWHSSHYVKLVLDEIMGEKNFVNEIIWCYKSGGSGRKHFSRKHDSILVYSKTPEYYINIPEEKSYNRGFKPYNFKGVKEYRDDSGWYTLVNMKDVWNIDMVGRTSQERNGYATQKPLELMRRIIEAGSREGDLVGDFFCGSGSFLEGAEMLGRKWAGCDTEKLAVSMARKRLTSLRADYRGQYMESTRADHGRLDVALVSLDDMENGRRLARARIMDFAPDIDIGYIQMSDREYIEEVLRNDTNQLIDYVMIGDVRGEAARIADNVRGDIIFTLPGKSEESDEAEEIELIAVDVFGREYPAILVIR